MEEHSMRWVSKTKHAFVLNTDPKLDKLIVTSGVWAYVFMYSMDISQVTGACLQAIFVC